METVFLCEDSMEGIFTGVYDGWASKKGHANIKLELKQCNTFRLFAEYINVKTDAQKARKVSDTVKNKMGEEALIHIMRAALAVDDEKADAIYRTIVVGLALKYKGKVMDCLSNPGVLKVFKLSRTVFYEADHMKGFIRFKELQNGVYFAKIAPKSHLLPIISPHFADRLPNENWMIYDENRGLFSIHAKQKEWVLVEDEQINIDTINKISENEERIQELWKCFFHTVSIKERENYNLQRKNLPIRFRENVLEFNN
ncbi:TIGR03915 family putative DNA repair protein [Anaerosacchariphilus polymeriproducens]|uniref:DNA metabolism protein n=1 Tax=Anaerosacchariphilus polymeriproducens TaxID=1812858 RepID=A0A371ASL8_9FIRM|nr:TIGR03915 family putative DNA repair protein [Anaerosacchariphilus polymeriproducens]RDU22564.1 DNA metabolism protein [Anaerosacchariphilus polymeriproducens]